MARTDANPPMMPYTDEYSLVEVDADYLTKAVKPKQFIHIDQTECIMCEGCVDICPWKCIHMVTPSAIVEATGTERPGEDPSDQVVFIIDDDICTRCALVRRPLPDRRDHPRQGRDARRRRRLPHPHQQPRLRLRDEVLTSDHREVFSERQRASWRSSR